MKAMKTTKLAAFLLALTMAFLAPGCSSPTLAGKREQVADYRWACPIRDLYWGIGQEEALREMGLSETEYTVLEPQGEEVEKGIVYLELKSPIAMFGTVPEYTRLVFYEDFGLTDIILLYRREQTQQVAQRAQQFLGKPQHRPTDYRKKGKKVRYQISRWDGTRVRELEEPLQEKLSWQYQEAARGLHKDDLEKSGANLDDHPLTTVFLSADEKHAPTDVLSSDTTAYGFCRISGLYAALLERSARGL